MFGCTLNEALDGIRQLVDRHCGNEILAVTSGLSDTQDLISVGESDQARQLLNRVKAWLWRNHIDEPSQANNPGLAEYGPHRLYLVHRCR